MLFRVVTVTWVTWVSWTQWLARLARLAGLAGLVALVALASCGSCSGCDGGGFPVDAAPPDAPPPGTVSLAWSITDQGGQPIQCDQITPNTTVFLQLRSHTTLAGAVVSFSCGNSPSTSQPIDAGTYDVSFELHGPDLTPVTAPGQTAVVIAPGQDTRLAPVTFMVDVRGVLVISLAAPPNTSNCKSPAMMGAGITGTTITLEHAGGGCAPVTFIHTRGTSTLPPYTVNCSSPQAALCIEVDEVLTVPSIASGLYVIHVKGLLGNTPCWKNDDALQVPPQGKALSQTLNLAHQSQPALCLQ